MADVPPRTCACSGPHAGMSPTWLVERPSSRDIALAARRSAAGTKAAYTLSVVVQAHAVEARLVAQPVDGAAGRVRPPRAAPVGIVAEHEGSGVQGDACLGRPLLSSAALGNQHRAGGPVEEEDRTRLLGLERARLVFREVD